MTDTIESRAAATRRVMDDPMKPHNDAFALIQQAQNELSRSEFAAYLKSLNSSPTPEGVMPSRILGIDNRTGEMVVASPLDPSPTFIRYDRCGGLNTIVNPEVARAFRSRCDIDASSAGTRSEAAYGRRYSQNVQAEVRAKHTNETILGTDPRTGGVWAYAPDGTIARYNVCGVKDITLNANELINHPTAPCRPSEPNAQPKPK